MGCLEWQYETKTWGYVNANMLWAWCELYLTEANFKSSELTISATQTHTSSPNAPAKIKP